MAVIVSGTVLSCCFVFGIILLCIKYSKKKKDVEPPARKILVIGDSGERHIKFLNEFTEILKKFASNKVEVITNVRKTSEITTMGIVHWITENLNTADVVVFIPCELEQIHRRNSKSDSENKALSSPVAIALGIAENLALNIGFQTAKNKFVVFDITNSIDKVDLPCCTLYTIEKGFKKLLKHVLGDHFNHSSNKLDQDVGVLQELAFSTENLPVSKCKIGCDTAGSELNNLTSSDDSETKADGNFAVAEMHNDLDRPFLYSHMTGMTLSSQQHSIENNEGR